MNPDTVDLWEAITPALLCEVSPWPEESVVENSILVQPKNVSYITVVYVSNPTAHVVA
ncbi:MAG: hypothetical protein RBT65_16775 [Methanolobus sp.]|nr:hypothetical protein [Methanolobus sp.]